MNTRQHLCCLFALALYTVRCAAADPATLDTHLEPLRPLLGKTWQGTFVGSKADKPVVDVMRWERALNGHAVRILHSINDGAYGGETLIVWDAKKSELGYHYFTTAGFMTTGTMRFEGEKVLTHELVTGSSSGVTEVRGTSQLRPDGTFHVKTEHLEHDQWRPGHEVEYRQNDSAEVKFK